MSKIRNTGISGPVPLNIIIFANVLSHIKQIITSNFHQFDAVGPGRETQLQVGDNYLI